MQLLETLARAGRAFLERRRAMRHETRCPAWIEFDDDIAPRNCTLVDVSEGGARLELVTPEDLPPEFSLVLIEDASHVRRCRVAWRNGQEVGVRYVEPFAR